VADTKNPRTGASLDVHATLANLGEMVVRKTVEPACGGLPLWDKGLGEVVGRIIENSGVVKQVSALDVAETLGLVDKKRGRRR
jgi:hypothetical protein